MMSVEQSTEFYCFSGLHLHLQFMFLRCVFSFIFLQKVFGVVPFSSLPSFLVLSLSFEDTLDSHGISGIISLFFRRDSIYILVTYICKCIIQFPGKLYFDLHACVCEIQYLHYSFFIIYLWLPTGRQCRKFLFCLSINLQNLHTYFCQPLTDFSV